MSASIESSLGKDSQITRHEFLKAAAAMFSAAVMPSISIGAPKARSSVIPRQGFAPTSGPARAFTAEIEAGL